MFIGTNKTTSIAYLLTYLMCRPSVLDDGGSGIGAVSVVLRRRFSISLCPCLEDFEQRAIRSMGNGSVPIPRALRLRPRTQMVPTHDADCTITTRHAAIGKGSTVRSGINVRTIPTGLLQTLRLLFVSDTVPRCRLYAA